MLHIYFVHARDDTMYDGERPRRTPGSACMNVCWGVGIERVWCRLKCHGDATGHATTDVTEPSRRADRAPPRPRHRTV